MIRRNFLDDGAFDLRLVQRERTDLENNKGKRVSYKQTSSVGNLMTTFNPYKIRMSKEYKWAWVELKVIDGDHRLRAIGLVILSLNNPQFTNRIFSHSFGCWKSKIKVSARLVSGANSLPGFVMLLFSLRSHMAFLYVNKLLVFIFFPFIFLTFILHWNTVD